MAIQSGLLTAEGFAALPRDGLRLELVRGEGRDVARLQGAPGVGCVSARREIVVYRASQPPRVLTTTDTLDGEDVFPRFTYGAGALFT